jgi:hypothetical protein
LAISTQVALEFTVRCQSAMLVAPAARELKLLLDIDNQDGMRFVPRAHHPVLPTGHIHGQ